MSEREQALIEEARLLRRLADNVPVAIAYYESRENRCQFANEGYARMFGHDPQSLLGLEVAEIIGAEAAAAIQPQVRIALDERRTASYERELPGPDGTRRHIEVSLVPHAGPDGVSIGAFVLIADITRHRRAEQALRESEDRLARFMQATAEGIVFHREGFITDANPPLLALLGHTLDEVRGRWALDFVAPDQRERVGAVMAAGAEVAYETAVQHRDGTRIPVEFIVRTMVHQGERLRMTVVRDMRDRLAAQQRIRHLAEHDALTGLPNRAAFIERLQERLAGAAAGGRSLALLFIDLDHFKRVNDSLGHLAGDTLLRTVAQRITAALRPEDLVARFGGDEFLVMLGGNLPRDRVAEVAHRLLAGVEAEVHVGGASISVTPSIGIAVFPADGADADTLVQHADTAMYAAKATGRAAVCFFEPAMAQRAYDDLVMESRLVQALRDGEFEVHFQPERDAPDGPVHAVEALVRWRDPARGLVLPEAFLPVAEARRLMLPLGRRVLQQALAAAAGWQQPGAAAIPVAVNVSALEFQDPGFVDQVQSALVAARLPGACLELELTERLLMEDLGSARHTLERLRALGIRIAVDDFGTGYTSLAHLRALPIDRLKIDRSFVHDLPHDGGAVAIVLTIIQLARALGIAVVAEGVETPAQRDWLLDQGCTTMQGWLIAPPVPAAELRL